MTVTTRTCLSATMPGILAATVLAATLAAMPACEDPPPPASSPQPSAEPAPLPSAIPSAKPASLQPEKPPIRKKLEDCPKGPKVAFDDAKIEEAVRFKLQKPQGAVTQADLAQLRSLNLSQIKLDELDICLFSHMKGLRELFLGRGKIDDLAPLAGATQLVSLRASMNPLRDIKPLAEMTKMDRLDLGVTQVSDLTPLSSMTQLTELQLDDTPVEDVKPLAKLTKLERLSLQRTRVKDYSPLRELKALKFVYVKGSPGEFDAMSQLGALAQSGLKIIAQ